MDLPSDRLFMDTGFVIARFNRTDQYHLVVRSLAATLDKCEEIWTTHAVLLGVGAAFSQPPHRRIAARLWDEFHSRAGPHRLAAISEDALGEAMELFRSRPDKSWSLADCLSFSVMEQEGLVYALTADRHFEQAGFKALML
jgi:uncharacterized protein